MHTPFQTEKGISLRISTVCDFDDLVHASFSSSVTAAAMPVVTSNGKETNKVNGEEESSNSDGDSSSYDEDESERRKSDCLDDIQYLEQQFSDLKELLYLEKLEEIDDKIQKVSEGNAPEYLHPKKELQRTLSQRLTTAEAHLLSKVRNIENKFEEEAQSAEQDFKELCKVTKQKMVAEVQDKIAQLKEESVVFQLTQERSGRKRKTKVNNFQLPEKRKRPACVTGPCIVYMLKDLDIMDDLNDIRKGHAGMEVQWPTRKGKKRRFQDILER